MAISIQKKPSLCCILNHELQSLSCLIFFQCPLLFHLLYFCCCSVTKSCLTLCKPMDCSTPGSSGLHYLLECVQINVLWLGDVILPSHPSFAFYLSQHQVLFQWVGSSNQKITDKVDKVLELQKKYFQWIFRVDFL